jgi:hypothetical protein
VCYRRRGCFTHDYRGISNNLFFERTEDLRASLLGSPSDALTLLPTPAPRMDDADSMPNESDELTRLRAENARLIALLESHGIDWGHPPAPTAASAPLSLEPSSLSTEEKVALFRRLFRGRTDVHPVRWESATTGKSGYAPACANEWRAGICEKPRIKCADCGNRALIPMSDAVIYSHLAGEKTIGVYPLLPDDTCYFRLFRTKCG